MTEFDFLKPTAPAAEAKPRVTKAPSKPGTIIVTDDERKVLKEFGWKEGEAVPDLTEMGIGEDEIKAILSGASSKVVGANKGPVDELPEDFQVTVPEPQDISTLSPERQAELAEAVKTAGEIAARAANAPQLPQAIPGMDPSVSAAIENAVKGEVDRLREPMEPGGHTMEEEMAMREAEEETVTAEQDKLALEAMAKAAASPEPQVTHCPHCNWPVQQEDTTEVTDVDKQLFVQSVLGRSRFHKRYTVLGDQLTIIFRSLTPEEADAAFEQAKQEFRDEPVQDGFAEVAFQNRLQEMRMLMSVEKIVAEMIDQFPPYSSYAHKGSRDELLSGLKREMYAKHINTEPLRRVVLEHYAKFARLEEKLEVMSYDSDFYKTGSSP